MTFMIIKIQRVLIGTESSNRYPINTNKNKKGEKKEPKLME